jgi:DNA-binding CsgD family transcriptional regulator
MTEVAGNVLSGLSLISGDAMSAVTLNGQIVDWNEAAEEQLHIPRECALGVFLADITSDAECTEALWGHHVTVLGAHLSGNPPVRHLLETRDRLGHPVRLHISSMLVRRGWESPVLVFSHTTEHLDSSYKLRMPPPLGLTAREWEVVSLMMTGRGTGEIAHHLGITYATVRAHIRNIFVTLDAKSRTQALMRVWSRFGAPSADT